MLRLVCSAVAMGPDMLRDLLTAGPVTARVILDCFVKEPEVCGYYRYATSLDPPVLKGCGDRKGLKMAKANIDVHVAVKVVHVATR